MAHCLRWSHVAKFLQRSGRYAGSIVLDVGCGKEVPLAKLLYVNKMTPKKYVGVDCNRFDVPEMLVGKKIPVSLWCETDVCALGPKDVGIVLGLITEIQPKGVGDVKECGVHGPYHYDHDGTLTELPNILVCYEVLEHVAPSHCRQMLQHFQKITGDDCHYFVSTPCYNGSAAQNHVNEVSFGALGGLLEDLGYNIEGVYGTFASISDYESELSAVTTVSKDTGKPLGSTDLRLVFAALRNYYDTNVLSVIFAPLFPAQSRNCLWHLTKKRGDSADQERLFSALEQAPTPWTSSPSWRDLAG